MDSERFLACFLFNFYKISMRILYGLISYLSRITPYFIYKL